MASKAVIVFTAHCLVNFDDHKTFLLICLFWLWESVGHHVMPKNYNWYQEVTRRAVSKARVICSLVPDRTEKAA